MEKLKQLISHISSISVELKKNNQPVNPLFSYLLVILGTVQLVKLLNKSYSDLLYPTLKRLFYFIFKRSHRLLTKDPFLVTQNKEKFVLIYGATNHMGQQTAKLFAKYNYSLILVDSSLDKLQKLSEELGKIFPGLTDDHGFTSERIKIININFAIWKDSTSLEHKIRETITLSMEIPIFVNCISFLNEWQVCEDKLFHEIQFDQIYQYAGNTIIGFTIFFNFFSRLIVHKKQQSCLINLIKKEVKPFDRTSYAMALLRVLYFPFYYHTLMERMNLMHYGLNKYIDEVCENAAYGYPLLKNFSVIIDSREARSYELKRLENKLNLLRY
ncbi:UNKNOWN [Stylonychia lemnae]|uniref:Uncharacterized protein n=1 Tax=Stylonychia lemnae TaxID=5949 RepID=A0A078AWM9_STYLE|nr:UNKNOWN [Stylonychia lemnae]|eukprot:CDW86441.1 UNKNOWN [Stylonychia lemnae]